jgi:hypothetical protein
MDVFVPQPVDVTSFYTTKKKVTKEKALGRTFFLLKTVLLLTTVATERS